MLTDNQMKALCEMLGYFPAFAEEKEAFNRLTADATKKLEGYEAAEKRCKDAER